MTENEAIEKCDKLINGYSVNYSVSYAFSESNEPYPAFRVMKEFAETCKNALSEIQQYKAIGTVKELKELKDYKELYDVYRNIGSIDEFRKLKNKKNVLPIANIIINEEDMQKIVDEKIKEIELDIQKIRAKAIDEFAEKICEKYTEEERNRNYRWYSAQIKQNIADIAEQMKAGGKNE